MLRDAMYFVVLLSWFFLPEQYDMLLFVSVAFTVGNRIAKAIKGNPARLESAEKRTYLLFTLLYFLVLLGLLLSWIIRHSSPAAWAMGSLGIGMLLMTPTRAATQRLTGRCSEPLAARMHRFPSPPSAKCRSRPHRTSPFLPILYFL
jgi:hypothetical protein